MKYVLLSFLFCALGSMKALAQINLKDSTVQTVAYWKLGDCYDYVFHLKNYKVQDGDTTIVKEYYEPFTIEVVDSTANHYTLEMRNGEADYVVMDSKTRQMKAMGLLDIGKGMPMYVRTSRFGEYQGLDKVPELLDTMKVMITKVGEMLRHQFSKQLPEKDVEKMMARITPTLDGMCTKEALELNFKPYLNLFYFHGIKMKFDAEISANLKGESPLIPGVPIDYTFTGWIADIEPETSYVTFGNKIQFNSDQLMQAYLKLIGNMFGKKIPDSPERPYIFVDEVRGISVHTNTGWTTDTYYKCSSTLGKQQTINEQTIDMIFE